MSATTIEGLPADIKPADRLLAVDGMVLNPAQVGQPAGLLVEHVATEHVLGADIGVRVVTVWGRTDMIEMRLTHDLAIRVRREG